MKKLLKKLIPKKLLNLRHLYFAWWGARQYGYPSEELFVIGITGTSGKSTTVAILRQLLETAGYTVGSLSTIDFYIAGEDKLNDQKMTMLGRSQIQQYLREMVDAGCDIAIVETTSEGRLQHRHRFINYDMMLLTNLYPEHIEAHGGFENYKQAKRDLFAYTANLPRKVKNGKTVTKVGLAHVSNDYGEEFLQYNFDATVPFGNGTPYDVHDVSTTTMGVSFQLAGYHFDSPLLGRHNVDNVVAALVVARQLDVDWGVLQQGVKQIGQIPGRLEFVPEASERGFQVLVDYAFEPVALQRLYDVVEQLKPRRIIHVAGATGGGRDVARRRPIGRLIAIQADVYVITDEDPYEEDPHAIMAAVKDGAMSVSEQERADIIVIPDRGAAIERALNEARAGDIVLITGKGSEQAMCVASGLIPWDDREAVRSILAGKPYTQVRANR